MTVALERSALAAGLLLSESHHLVIGRCNRGRPPGQLSLHLVTPINLRHNINAFKLGQIDGELFGVGWDDAILGSEAVVVVSPAVKLDVPAVAAFISGDVLCSSNEERIPITCRLLEAALPQSPLTL